MITEYHRPTMVYDPEKEHKWGCGHTPEGFYNLEPWRKKNQSSDDYVEIVLEASE